MKSIYAVTALAIMCVGGTVAAAEPATRAVNARRQMIDCMSRQMSASKLISYNQAAKVCKELAKAETNAAPASTVAKSVDSR